MFLQPSDWTALLLTAKLAFVVTLVLLVLGTPLAWGLARSKSWWKGPVEAVVALPLVLPPTVLGFYLLVAMGPQGWLGRWMEWMGMEALPFSFAGLVVASLVYSLPFMVQPLQNTFEHIGDRPIEVAATLRASPLVAFFTVIVPMARKGFVSAGVLTFAHTIGEFGLVLMIGGNLPGKTRVASVQIFDLVESMNFAQANRLAGVLLVFSFLVLLWVYARGNKPETVI